MCDRASDSDISFILEKAKLLISSGNYDFVPRRKNLLSLSAYGMTVLDAKSELLSVEVSDYYKGPKKDFDRPGEIWEFKRNINGIIFYIKIKIDNEDGKEILKCLGFHVDEF